MEMSEVHTGMDHNRLIACNSTNCFSLQDGSWKREDKMLEGRSSAGSSNSRKGWLVSGGISADGATLRTTEYYTKGKWTPGPELPRDSDLKIPCQVQIGSKVIITGYIF